ncbi:MAG: sulfatase-like hydrolase/transferase [Cyclobacteriaceae bacterium]
MNRDAKVLVSLFFLVVWIAAINAADAGVENGTRDIRPNIIFITTDQQEANSMSCAGNGDVKTPNMDRIARAGVRFTKTYSTFPLCTPSRASIYTGKMPHELGVYSNNKTQIQKSDFEFGLGSLLLKSGYDCAYGGKWHVPELDIPEDIGFRKIADMDESRLTQACIEYLREKHERPFFLVASYESPHGICEWARGQTLPYGEIKKTDLENCPSLPRNFPIAPFEPGIIRIEQQSNPHAYPTRNFTPEDWRQYLHAYYRLVEQVDNEIGQILDEVDRLKLEDNTIIIFSSDHGDGIAAHNWNQKTVLYEESAKVPLIISYPGVSQKDIVNDTQLVSLGLDILPTVCDYANVPVPKGLKGLSLRPLIEGRKVDQWRDYVIVETMFDGKSAHQTKGRSLISDKFKYIIYDLGKNREQLFDLEKDPGEMVNLVQDGKYKSVLNKMRGDLLAWSKETGDTLEMRRFVVPK